MAKLFEMYAELGIEDKAFRKGMADAIKSSDQLKKAAGEGGESLKQMFSVTGGIQLTQYLNKAKDLLVGFAKDSLTLASDLQEVQNVVDVTFGDGANEINAWSKAAKNAFGLSEIKAKQYNGTIGAMLKSMGLADDQIIEMSTSLVGLTGDMSSFYNLDHDAAFEKIRAGLSGETEPLKQLGINMSVANLEAYAMSRGIDKAYNSMTQAEQVALRYSYLLETTSSAQGDFASTSENYANALRTFQTNMDEKAAAFGDTLIDFVTPALNTLNDWMSSGTFEAQMKDVSKEYSTSIANTIRDYEVATLLLDDLAQMETAQAALKAINDEGNKFASVLQTAIGDENLFDSAGAKAAALTETGGAFTAVSSAMDGISEAMNAKPAGQDLLDEIAASAAAGKDTVAAIDGSLTNIRTSLEGTVEGGLLDGLSQIDKIQGDAVESSEKWKRQLQLLVQTMPDLSRYIDEQNGTIKTSVASLKEYAAAVKNLEMYEAALSASASYSDLATTAQTELDQAILDQQIQENMQTGLAQRTEQFLAELSDKYGYETREDVKSAILHAKLGGNVFTAEEYATYQALSSLGGAVGYSEKEREKDDKRIEELRKNAERAKIEADLAESIVEAADAETKAQYEYNSIIDQMSDTIDQFEAKVAELEEYRDRAVQAAREALEASVSGFDAAPILADYQRSADQIKANLDSQTAYFTQYATDLERARTLGLNEDMLAMLSDGSEQSVADLKTIVNADKDQIAAINKAWEESEAAREIAAQGMATNQLLIDQEFDDMVSATEQLIKDLNQYDEARSAMLSTGSGVINALDETISAFNSRLSVLRGQASSFAQVFRVDVPTLRSFSTAASNAKGLDYVPYDNYLSYLHKGETVLPRPEAERYRAGRSASGAAAIDYTQLAAALSDSLLGVAVNMDGKQVGMMVAKTVSREIEHEAARQRYRV